jgi:hypothetical protein
VSIGEAGIPRDAVFEAAEQNGKRNGAAETTDSVSIVVPTRNEQGSVGELLTRLAATSAAAHTTFEVLIVDDSDDGTAATAELAAAGLSAQRPRFSVQVIHRQLRERTHGLSGAVVRGLAVATGRWVVVMDGDLQHPPEIILDLLHEARERHASLVVASRYVTPDASRGSSLSWPRRAVSRTCAVAARALFPRRLAKLTDPMSGFFLVERERLELARLRPEGFKIQLEILATHPELTIAEVPFTFAPRRSGSSKASYRQGVAYGHQLASLRLHGTRGRTPTAHHYDIHGLFRLRSDRALPELARLRVVSPTGPPDLVVEVGGLLKVGPGETLDLTGPQPVACYRERAGFAVDVTAGPSRMEVRVSPFVARSPHVLYTNVVEPILRWKLVERGHVLVHAACFANGGDAWLLTAKTDTGKTTTMLKLLGRLPVEFLSDDLTLLSPDGEVLTYPKPLTISAHTVHALGTTDLVRSERLALKAQSRVHSREGRRAAFALTRHRLPVASLNAIVQRLVPPPKYHVERLVPGVALGTRSRVAGLLIIERGGAEEVALTTSEALATLVANCDDAYGFPPYATLEHMLLAMSPEDLRSKERELIERALGSTPACLLRSEHLDWAERIPSVLAAWSDNTSTVASISA